MSKYIDAENLKELLDRKYKEFTEKAKKDCPLQYQYMADGLEIAKQFVDSLQQEQQEVDLEKEIDACWQNWISPSNQSSVEGVLPKSEFYMYARHFYEIGLNAIKEESK